MFFDIDSSPIWQLIKHIKRIRNPNQQTNSEGVAQWRLPPPPLLPPSLSKDSYPETEPEVFPVAPLELLTPLISQSETSKRDKEGKEDKEEKEVKNVQKSSMEVTEDITMQELKQSQHEVNNQSQFRQPPSHHQGNGLSKQSKTELAVDLNQQLKRDRQWLFN
ncbi:MAG: hypothetical protein F6K47_29375, partial [Symploca sp. SIO2E6]|nr:hypothetical protein [Symploca sp. SIO2E6]